MHLQVDSKLLLRNTFLNHVGHPGVQIGFPLQLAKRGFLVRPERVYVLMELFERLVDLLAIKANFDEKQGEYVRCLSQLLCH